MKTKVSDVIEQIPIGPFTEWEQFPIEELLAPACNSMYRDQVFMRPNATSRYLVCLSRPAYSQSDPAKVPGGTWLRLPRGFSISLTQE